MCREDVTYWYGEMVLNEIVIKCGNITVDYTKCQETAKTGGFLRRLFQKKQQQQQQQHKCAITVRTLTKVKSLCPQCRGLLHDDPFLPMRLHSGATKTPHFIHSPPPSPTSALNARARAAAMPFQNLPQQFAAPTRPSTSYQPYRHGSSSRHQPTSHSAARAVQRPQRSLTQPGLQRSHAVRRPSSSRAESSHTRPSSRQTRTDQSNSTGFSAFV